jgi:hypothetical protein
MHPADELFKVLSQEATKWSDEHGAVFEKKYARKKSLVRRGKMSLRKHPSEYAALAREAKISAATVKKLLNGGMISLKNASLIANVLGLRFNCEKVVTK